MEVDEIISKIKEIRLGGTALSKIEMEAGIPKNNLSKMIRKKFPISDTNKSRLEEFIRKHGKPMHCIPLDEWEKIRDFMTGLGVPMDKEYAFFNFKKPEKITIIKGDENAKNTEPVTIKLKPPTIYGENIDKEAILKQIKEIESEKIPKERDTYIGRKVWGMEQQKRINELKSKLI